MKSKNYILSVLATGLMTGSMVSCSDFLDTKPSTSVDDTDVFQTTSGAQSALNGCYYQMRAYGSGGANRGDDYGIPSIQMISDMCGEDVMNNGSGWYLYNYNSLFVVLFVTIKIGEKLKLIYSVQISCGPSITGWSIT